MVFLKNKEKGTNSIKNDEENKQKKKKEKISIANVIDHKLTSTKKINPLNKNIKNDISTENKKHYLNNIDKALLKEDISCISYTYKNLNEQKFSKKKIKNVSENNKVHEILSLEKKKKNKKSENNYDGDKSIQSIIYDTFINKNLKLSTNNLLKENDFTKKKKTTFNVNKPNNINSSDIRNNFNNWKKKNSKDSTKYLIAEKIEKNYVDNFVQVTEINKQSISKQNIYDNICGETKKKDNKSTFTQTNFPYEEEEIKSVAKFFTKKIMNEAFIQITYEQNFKQIEQKTEFINLNNKTNKQTLTYLTNSQHNNLDIMKEKNKITNYLQIFNKINIFSISRNIINCLMDENIVSAKEKNELNKTKELEWFNEAIKNLLKNTVAFLTTEKIVSYITEELIEDSLLNFCLFNKKDMNKINNNLNNNKIYMHKKRKIEKGYIKFLLLNEKIKIYIPIKIKEDMSLDDIIKKIKKFINRKLGFLSEEYNLNIIIIKNEENNIMDIKDLYSCESEEFRIYLEKKKK